MAKMQRDVIEIADKIKRLGYWDEELLAEAVKLADQADRMARLEAETPEEEYEFLDLEDRWNAMSPDDSDEAEAIISAASDALGVDLFHPVPRFEAIEDNGGGLHLCVLDEEGKCVYYHTGYEYNDGQLREDLHELWCGDQIAGDASKWDGNCGGSDWEYGDDPDVLYRGLIASEDRDIVADNNGLYPDRMGSSAKREFLGEDKWWLWLPPMPADEGED